MIARKHESIMVLLYKLSKEDNFIPVKSMHKTNDIGKIIMKEIFRLHGLWKAMILDMDAKFTSKFWKGFF